MRSDDKLKMIKVAVLVDKEVPTDHSFIQGVLEKSLNKENISVTFFGYKSDLPQIKRDNVAFITVEAIYQNFFLKKLHKIFCFTKLIKKSGHYNVLFTRNDPVYLIIAWWLKLTKVIQLHFHQISHLHAFAKSEGQILYRIKAFGDLFIRSFFLNYADKILVISNEMMKFLKKEWPKHSDKYIVFPLGVNVSDFEVIKPYSERIYDVVYIGTLASSRQIDVIIDALKIYNDKYGKLNLHIWGESTKEQDNINIKNYVNKNGLDNLVTFYGKISRMEVLEKLKDTKIGLSTIPCTGILNQISPTKLMEYLAAGCCVIATDGISDQERIIKGAYRKELISFDASEIARSINDILIDEPKAIKLSKLGRDYIFKERSYKEMSKKLRSEIDVLLPSAIE